MCSYEYDDETGYRGYIECGEARTANDKLFCIEQLMRRVVKQLYSDERLDVCALDDLLGQICDSLGYELPPNMPKVRRQGTEFFEFAASINQ